MANIQHSTVTDPNIHEPKGASTASIGTVYTSTGLGSGQWTKLSASSLSTIGASEGDSFEADGIGGVVVKRRFLRIVVPSGTFTSVAGNNTVNFTLSVVGVLDTDEVVAVTKATTQTGLFIASVKAAAGSIILQMANITGSAITPTAEDIRVILWRV